MTWTSEQEREYQELDGLLAPQLGELHRLRMLRATAVAELAADIANLTGGLSRDGADAMMRHADALIALLQPFASAPEPEQITDSVECPCGILHTKKAAGWHQTKVAPDQDCLSRHGAWIAADGRLHKPQETKA